MSYTIKRVLYIVVMLAVVLNLGSSIVLAEQSVANQLLQRIAAKYQLQVSALQLGDLRTITLPLTGVTLHQAKAIDIDTGKIYGLVLDEQGREADLSARTSAERAARLAQHGRLEPALVDRLATMSDKDRVTVGIWLRADELSAPDRPSYQPQSPEAEEAAAPNNPLRSASAQEKARDQRDGAAPERVAAIRAGQAAQRAAIDAARSANAEQLQLQIAAIQQPLLTDLKAQGYQPTYVSPIAPLVYVDLPKSEILAVAQRADVDTVYGPNDYHDLMNSAKPTQKANVVDAWGFDGTGIDVAILEDSRIQFTNPYLVAGTTRVPGDPNVDNHATATAGMVASQHGTYQGIAQGAALFSANATTYSDANLSAAMDWAASTQNVDVINNSWGGDSDPPNLNVHDRHLDYIVRNLWSTVTVAAGNEADGCGTTAHVTSPARGYNMISVGNYEDQNTLTWDDDAMDPCSSYVDPSSGIEKPEVAAVGSDINSTTMANPWVGNVGSGTSYAAPMVAGESALLMDRNSSLEVLPEAVKAIVMASALNNIEGDTRLSELDGAGGVDMRAAFKIVDEGWWDWHSGASSSFPYTVTFHASAGEVVRAAIAWDSNPAANYSTDPLQADIDLLAYDPGNALVAFSTSIVNSYEILEFTAATSGIYALRVNYFSGTGTNEFVGLAYWPGHRTLSAYTGLSYGTPPVSYDYFRASPGLYWQAIGIRSPSAGDYDIALYQASAFDDPADHTWLEDSTTTLPVDFVVIDRNHAPGGSYYPEVRADSGSGSYPIEWASWTGDIGSSFCGRRGTYTLGANDVLRVWDMYLNANQFRRVVARPTAGTGDLGITLMDSDGATPATYYQGRSTAVAFADSHGAGLAETLTYINTGSGDWMGLVVYNNTASAVTFDLEISPCFVYLPLILK